MKYWLYPYQEDIKIISGNRPHNNEVVIGKKFADEVIKIYGYDKKDYDSVIGFKINNYIVSGVVENETMTAYFNPILMYMTDKQNNRGNIIMIDKLDYYNGAYKIISGNKAISNNEIIIDKSYANLNSLNVSDTIRLGNNSYIISGIFEELNKVDVPSILANDALLYGKTVNPANNTISNTKHSFTLTYLPKNEYEIILGRQPMEKSECIVHVGSNLDIGESIYGYKIVGKYNKLYDSGSLGSNFMFDDIVIISSYNYSNTKYELAYEFNDAAKEFFEDNKYTIYNLDDYQRYAIRKKHQTSNVALIVFSAFLLGAGVLLTYLTNRGRLISEIHTIGVYRSIGKSRKCLIYQKIGYNFLMTSVSTIIGYAVSWIIYGISNNITKVYQEIVPINPLILIIGIVVLYCIGIFIGVVPTVSLIKKTPAEINSKYDI